MRFVSDRIEISYRESQVLRNAALKFRDEILGNAAYLVDNRKKFWSALIVYGRERTLQKDLAEGLLMDMLAMDDCTYSAFTEFINHLVISEKITIMGTIPLKNGMEVHQLISL